MNLNLGHQDRISPQHIISLINRSTKGSKVPIGRIDIGPSKSSVQIDANYAEVVEKSLKRAPFGEKRIKLDIQKEASPSHGSNKKEPSFKKAKSGKGHNRRRFQ